MTFLFPIRMDRHEVICGSIVKRLTDGRMGVVVTLVGPCPSPVVAVPKNAYFLEGEREPEDPSVDMLEFAIVEDQTEWIIMSEPPMEVDIWDDSEQ